MRQLYTKLFPYTTLFRSRPHLRRRDRLGRSRTPDRRGKPPRRRRSPKGISRRCSSFPRDTAFHRARRSEEHTSELQSHVNLVCRLLLEKKNDLGGMLIDWNTAYVYKSIFYV